MAVIGYFELKHATARKLAAAAMDTLPEGTVIVAREPTRSLEQNARMWAMLTDVAEQVPWLVDGALRKLEPDDWKAIFTAALRKEQRIAQGIDGGFVVMPQRTSQMSKRELSDLMELIAAFGAERGVVESVSALSGFEPGDKPSLRPALSPTGHQES